MQCTARPPWPSQAAGVCQQWATQPSAAAQPGLLTSCTAVRSQRPGQRPPEVRYRATTFPKGFPPDHAPSVHAGLEAANRNPSAKPWGNCCLGGIFAPLIFLGDDRPRVFQCPAAVRRSARATAPSEEWARVLFSCTSRSSAAIEALSPARSTSRWTCFVDHARTARQAQGRGRHWPSCSCLRLWCCCFSAVFPRCCRTLDTYSVGDRTCNMAFINGTAARHGLCRDHRSTCGTSCADLATPFVRSSTPRAKTE